MRFQLTLNYIQLYNHNGKVSGFKVLIPFSRKIEGITSDDTCQSGTEFRTVQNVVLKDLAALEIYLEGVGQLSTEFKEKIGKYRNVIGGLQIFKELPKQKFRAIFSLHPEIVGFMILPPQPHSDGFLFLYRGKGEEGAYPNIVLNLRGGKFAQALNRSRVEVGAVPDVHKMFVDWYVKRYQDAVSEGESFLLPKKSFHEVQNKLVDLLKASGYMVRAGHIVTPDGKPYKEQEIYGEWCFASDKGVLTYESILKDYGHGEGDDITLEEFITAAFYALETKGLKVITQVGTGRSVETYSNEISVFIQYAVGFAASHWYDLQGRKVDKVKWEDKLNSLSPEQIQGLFHSVSGKTDIEGKVVMVLDRLVKYEVCGKAILGRKERIIDHCTNIMQNFRDRTHHDETLGDFLEGGKSGVLSVTAGEFFADQTLGRWEKSITGTPKSQMSWVGHKVPKMPNISISEIDAKDFAGIVESGNVALIRRCFDAYVKDSSVQSSSTREKIKAVLAALPSHFYKRDEVFESFLAHPYYSKEGGDFVEIMKILLKSRMSAGKFKLLMQYNTVEEIKSEYEEDILCAIVDSWELHGNVQQQLDSFRSIAQKLEVTCSTLDSLALHRSVKHGHTEMVSLLLTEEGVDVNIRGARGRTPLHVVVECGNLETFKLLMSQEGIDVEAQDEMGDTPLHMIGLYGQQADEVQGMVKMLVAKYVADGLDLNVPNKRGVIPLTKACFSGMLETVKLLLENGADADLRTLVISAVVGDDPGLLKLGIAYGGIRDVDFRRVMLRTAIQHERLNVVGVLLNEDNVNGAIVKGGRGQDLTPLGLAIESNRPNMVGELVKYGANVNAPTGFKTEAGQDLTPLEFAMRLRHRDRVEELIKCGAAVELSCLNSKYALVIARHYTDANPYTATALAVGVVAAVSLSLIGVRPFLRGSKARYLESIGNAAMEATGLWSVGV